ncbi:MAG TPA: LCP family protein [Ornithinibacter sp.]|nr:LCP family protein [Ornithinibacter sp.]
MSQDDVSVSSRRPGDPEPPPRRAEIRYPPGVYYRRLALATVLPGAGLLRTRWRVAGWVLLVSALAVGGFLLWRAWQDGLVRTVLDAAVQPEVLQAIGVAVMVGGVLWIGSIVLTAEQNWPRVSRGRWARVLAAVVACTVVAVPAAMAVRYLDVQSSIIDEVFAAPDTAEPAVALADVDAEDPWADVARVNTLLIGSDAGKDRWGTRTDSLMVVSTNTRTGDTLLVGIPRNLERVPFPEGNPLRELYPNGYDCGDECLMNGIWTLADSRPDLFPGVESPGRQATVDVVGEITGLEIDHSVVVNLRGFRALVDAMGGVDVNVQQRVCVECHQSSDGRIVFTGDTEEWIEPGLQHLDGRHALWYARSRAGSDDFSRMRRQRCVAGALMEQADPAGLLARYPQLARVVKDNVSIDIPPAELSAWVDLALRIQEGDSIRSLPLTSKVVPPGNPDFDEIRALVTKALKPPKATTSPTATSTATASPSPTSSPSSTSSPSPTATPDDSEAVDLSATC